MIKEKRILIYAVGYLLVGLFICLIGISDVFADTYDYTQYTAQLYDNYGPSLSAVTTDITNNRYQGIIPNMTGNTSGAAWGISSPISLLSNHTYTMTVTINGTYGGNIVLSTYNRIGVGSSLSNAITSYQNNSSVTENYSKVLNDGMTIQFAFTPTINASYIVFPFATSSSGGPWTFYISDIIIDDLGSKSLTEEEINNSLNNQTNDINNSIQNSTDNIINNQNQNNEELKDTIKDNFNSCRDSYNLLYTPYTVDNKLTDTALRDDYFNSLNYHVTLQAGKTYTFGVETDGIYGGQTGSDTVEIIFLKGPNFTYFIPMGSNPFTFIPQETGDYYIRYDINQNGKTHSFWNFQVVEGSSIKKWEQAGVEVCQNKIDETNDKIDETNQQLGDLNNSLTDSSPTDMSSLGDSAGWLPAGPVDSILTLPLTMLNSLVSNLSNNSCQTISVELPFVKKNITLPCVRSLYDKMGVTGTLFTTAGLIASAFILFNYLLALYKWVDDTLTMRENTMPGYFDDNWGGGA